MISPLRSSFLRVIAGGTMAFLGLGILLFALPNASTRRERSLKAAKEAGGNLVKLNGELQELQDLADRLQADRQSMDGLLANMPAETVGHLHWKLSQKVFELAGKHEVHLLYVKYGAPSREGAKGSLLEALDVEFTVAGIFRSLKGFMLDLEGSRLPFAVVSAKLDEGPDGVHLTVTLRAFRQAPHLAAEHGEGA